MLGQTISHYRITDKLGEGGMGVVYKAEDLKLGRAVALKFLPPHLLDSEEHKTRFLHEARAAALLDHPNICTVYEIDEANGQTFLAMACLAGQTLKQKIAARPLPLQEALDIALQIGQGLQAAHEKGIVHRDIKPANIMITPQGQVKIMDFGLAQLSDRTKLTVSGMKLGTPAYMSPEQTEGKPADRRSDIWALGVVLYEMISGRVPFAGEAEAAVAYAILHAEPEPLTALRSGLPIQLDSMTFKALAKQPEDRYQHVEEMIVDTRAVQRGLALAHPAVGQTPSPQTPAAQGVSRKKLVALASLAAAGMIALAFWIARTPPSVGPALPTRFVVSMPQDHRLSESVSLALSPDGTRLVFSAESPRGRQLFVRHVDQFESVALAGTEGATGPFFSPNGRWVGFFADGKMQKISLNGGPPSVVTGVSDPLDAAWGPDDTIVFSQVGDSAGLRAVPAAGGTPKVLTTGIHGAVAFLPGGRDVLYTGWGGSSGLPRTFVASLETGEARTILEDGGNAQYLAPGYLVYVRAGTLMVAPFDVERLTFTGPAAAMVDGVTSLSDSDVSNYAVSSNGSLAYHRLKGSIRDWSIWWVERDGSAQALTSARRHFLSARLSPDGKWLAVDIQKPGDCDIWLYEFAQDTFTRLTHGGDNHDPSWSVTGERVAFNSRKTGVLNLYWAPVRGGESEPLVRSVNPLTGATWKPDGKSLAFSEFHPETKGNIHVLTMDSNSTPRPFLATQFDEKSPAFSPDGNWLAYVSDETGEPEVYVQRYPEGGQKRKVSTQGGSNPVWPRNGSELFYRIGDRFMAVPIRLTPEFNVGKPTQLFSGPYGSYDVSADSQRFVMIKPEGSEESTQQNQIYVVMNWVEEVKRKVELRSD